MTLKPEVLFVGGATAPQVVAGNYITVSWPPSAKPNTYRVVANVDGAQTTIGEFTVPRSPFAGRMPVLVKADGPFIVAGAAAAMSAVGSIALFAQAGPDAAMTYDPATTEMLGAAGADLRVEKPTRGTGA